MIFALKGLLVKLENDGEKGQTLIEYALLVVLIAIVVIVALNVLGPQLRTTFSNISTSLQ